MKNFLLTAVALLLSVMAAAQTDYEMVVEKTDGSKSVFNTNIIKQTYFQKLDQESGIFQGAKRVFGNNLVKAFGEEGSDRYEVNYDAKGFVTGINRTIFYESGNRLYSWLFNYNTAGKIIMNYYRDGMLGGVYSATIGSNGYIKSINTKAGEMELYYDYEEHLTQILINYFEDDETFTDYEFFTWQEGDIISGKYIESDHDEESTSIAYISPTHMTPIENIGGVMEDDALGIGMEEIDILYFIGGLGKWTKHLPMSWTSGYYSGLNVWTLDSQNRPIKMENTIKRNDESYSENQTFFWEW